MPFVLESLVGYLYVVGGRSISTVPPGTLVEVAPRKAARGREADTFFTMVLPSGEMNAPSTFYENLAQLGAERYFESTGSVTSGLREVFHTINKNLFDHNANNKNGYEANMICAVLRGNDLIIGRVGAGVVVLREMNKTLTFPEDLSNDDAIYTMPLGVQSEPNIRMRQYRVDEASRVLFCDAQIADFDLDQISNVLLSTDLSLVLVGFKEMARLQLTMMAVEFVKPEQPVPETVPIGESTAQIAEAAREVKRSTRDERRKERQLSTKVTKATQNGLSSTAQGAAKGLILTNKVLERFFGTKEEDEQKTFLSSPVSTGLVILLPVAVVIVMVVLWLSGMGRSQFEQCLTEVRSRRDVALQVPTNEVQTTLNAWDLVLAQISECEEIRVGDPTINTIRADGLGIIDALNRIDRRETIPLHVLFSGARIVEIELSGTDLYVLEETSSVVYRVPLTPDGREVIVRSVQPLDMASGLNIDGYTIGDIIDITINNNGDVVGLDSNGVMITCSSRFNECEAQQLLASEEWANPVAIEIWGDDERFYILDSIIGSGRILRYDKSGGIYPNTPITSVDALDAPVDFAIEETGTFYVAFSNGTGQRYRSGEILGFNFDAFPAGQELDTITSMYFDDSPTCQCMFVVHQGRATIYETGAVGFWIRSFQSLNQEFNLIEDIVASAELNLIYVVSGNTIFAFERIPT